MAQPAVDILPAGPEGALQRAHAADKFGAPAGLMDLERQIDATAGTQRWIRIDEATLRQMVADGNVPSVEQKSEYPATGALRR